MLTGTFWIGPQAVEPASVAMEMTPVPMAPPGMPLPARHQNGHQAGSLRESPKQSGTPASAGRPPVEVAPAPPGVPVPVEVAPLELFAPAVPAEEPLPEVPEAAAPVLELELAPPLELVAAQSQAPKVPSDRHTWAPERPFVHVHETLAPGTQRLPPLLVEPFEPLEHAPSESAARTRIAVGRIVLVMGVASP